jgi:hypothetical protein
MWNELPTLTDKTVLGIDPGRDKTGVALVDSRGKVLQAQVVPTAQVAAVLPELAARAAVLVIGDGTTSRAMQQQVRDLVPDKQLVVVNETSSTEAARPLYWHEHPPTGWRKLLPQGLLVPPVPLDGYAAAVLARRYLEDQATTVQGQVKKS